MAKYDCGTEPTNEEFATYMKVEHYYRAAWVAGWLETHEEVFGYEPLTQEQFQLLVARFEQLDFDYEEDSALGYEYDELIDELDE